MRTGPVHIRFHFRTCSSTKDMKKGTLSSEARERIMDASGFLFILILGIIVIAISYALDHLWAAAMPVRVLYLFIRFPGVVLHECAHIIGCLVSGARIQNVVLFSKDGGSVTYSRPLIPYIGDVIISTAPLFLLPIALSFITRIFATRLGCVFPAFPAAVESPESLQDLVEAIAGTFPENLLIRFNGWFLLYLYLTISIVLSIAPSRQDMKNAASGVILLTLAGVLVVWSGIPSAVYILSEIMHLLGSGFTPGLVYGLVALAVSLPLVFWYALRQHA
ncbi:MAG: metalloprotease family protein [Methanomicrobiales archaeon]|nr:metalloprotease family protein [Methanomicrobiales archaeon]